MSGCSIEKLSLDALMYMIHHVFLPPCTPQQDDYSPKNEIILLDTVSEAIKAFGECAGDDQKDIIQFIGYMMDYLRKVRDASGEISEVELGRALGMLFEKGMIHNPQACSVYCSLTIRRWSYPTSYKSAERRFHH